MLVSSFFKHFSKLFQFQEEEYLSGFGMEGSQYSGYIDPGYGARSRLVDAHAHSGHGSGALGGPGAGHQASITSELEGDKMVLKIAKPPRDKDSLMSLTWQCCSWMVTVIIGSSLDNWVIITEATESLLISDAQELTDSWLLFNN